MWLQFGASLWSQQLCSWSHQLAINYAPREHFVVQASLMMLVIYDRHVFIAQAIVFIFFIPRYDFSFLGKNQTKS
jgi:hypothetical protein